MTKLSGPAPKTLYEEKKAALEEQIRLDNLGKAPKEPKFEVVVPPNALQAPAPVAAPAAGIGEHRCGVCPGWKRFHPQAPFGQCLPAIRWLGQPMYVPDFAGCSMPIEMKAKGANR